MLAPADKAARKFCVCLMNVLRQHYKASAFPDKRFVVGHRCNMASKIGVFVDEVHAFFRCYTGNLNVIIHSFYVKLANCEIRKVENRIL